MTVPVREPPSTLTASLHIPPSQNTAPVYEHRCLYTHDLRRKQKRWQDGFLKYHTFNKRIMVYDVPRNYIGDMHAADEVQDGDEVTLERGAVMVQVGERVAMAETDLSGVIHKRREKDTEQNSNVEARRSAGSLQPRSSNMPPRTPARFIGWAGRAMMPQKSPFELRQTVDLAVGEQDSERPAKRQRREEDNHIPLWEILKTSRPIRAGPPSTSVPVAPTPLRIPAKAPTKPKNKIAAPKAASNSQGRLNVKEVVDITSSIDDTAKDSRQEAPRMRSSRVTPEGQPSPGSRQISTARQAYELSNGNIVDEHSRSSSVRQPQSDRCTTRPPVNEQRSEPTGHQSRTLDGRTKSRSSKPRKQPIPPCEPSSPPVSTTNHLPPTGPQAQAPTIDLELEVPQTRSEPQPEKRVLKPLRIASRAPRKLLMCEDEDELVLPASKPLSTPTEDTFIPIELADPQLRQQTSRAQRDSPTTREGRTPTHLHHNTAERTEEPDSIPIQIVAARQNHPNANDESISEALQLPEGSPEHHLAETNASESLDIPAQRPQETRIPAAKTVATKTASLRRNATDPSAASNSITSRFKQPLRRVETHPAAERTDNNQSPNSRAAPELDRNAGGIPGGDMQTVKDAGPWSREAWDLFGWCPESKKAALGWSYG